MTVSPSHIWKSAASAVRQPARTREKHLHIGSTLQDLYPVQNIRSDDGPFADLLQELETAERQGVRSRA